MELARGSVTDRPWGRTLGALALRGLTGEVTVTVHGKRYLIAFAGGTIVGARSPLASDAAVRIALTAGLVSSTQVSDIARRQAADPTRDEVDVIAEAARLGSDHALRLRRRAVAQRAARTFSLDRGEFVVDDQITLPLVEGTALDVRTVVYLGARSNLSEPRLAADLVQMGQWFRMKPEAVEDLPLYGFTADVQPVLQLLGPGATLPELEASAIDPYPVHVVIYSLVSCGALELESITAQAHRTTQAISRIPVAAVGPTDVPTTPPTAPFARPPTPLLEPATVRAASPMDAPTDLRRRRTSRPPPPTRNRADSAQASDILALIGERLKLLDEHGDHYRLLGVPHDVSVEALRKTYFSLAKQLHPDRLASLGITDDGRNAQRLFAEVNAAFAVLSDPVRRSEYTSILKRGGAAAVRADEAKAEAMAQRVIESEEAYRRGQLALARDNLGTALSELARALELNPGEADYEAALAFAQFVAAADKMAVAPTTRASLAKTIQRSPRAVSPRFYLGRIERMLGKDREALQHFHDVMGMQPNHAEAKSEARVIETRLAKKK